MRDLTALETGNIHLSVIGGIVDAFGGGRNKRASSAADKLIQGVRQATDAELAGLDAARAAAMGGAVGAGLRGRRGIADALTFLTGQGIDPLRATDFGVSPGMIAAVYGQAGNQPLDIFGEDGTTALLNPSAVNLGRSGLLAGMDQGPGHVAGADRLMETGMMPRGAGGIQPQQAINTQGASPVPFAAESGGLMGAVRDPFQPFVEAGQEAVGQLRNPLEQFMNDPGFRFRLEQGQKAVERSAAARGGLVSGQTLQDVQQFGQQTASQEYQNAFNRALATAGLGLGAAGTQAGMTADAGQKIIQGLLGLGQQESDIAQQVADIAGESALGAGQAIANRERILGEIKAGKKASQLTAGEQIDQALNPLLGLGLGGVAAFGLPDTSGLFRRNTFTGRNLTPAEQLIASFGVGE